MIKEDVIVDGREMQVLYDLGDECYGFKFEIKGDHEWSRHLNFNRNLHKARKRVCCFQQVENVLKTSKSLNEHFATWYPFPDTEMMENRQEDPRPKTVKIRDKWSVAVNKCVFPDLEFPEQENPFFGERPEEDEDEVSLES